MRSVLLCAALLALCAGSAFAANLPPGPGPTEYRAYVLVGDKDNFEPGHPEDIAPTSPLCEQILRRSLEWSDMGEPADLDEEGTNRPVALTLFAQIPPDARVKTAVLKFRMRATDALVSDDCFRITHDPFPLVALKDVLGFEPGADETHFATLDLTRIPVRNSLNLVDNRWVGGPDGYRSLLPQLRRNGQVDVVFMDDTAIDYAELVVEYRMRGEDTAALEISADWGTGSYGFTFSLAQAGDVRLQVFDVGGRRVADVLERSFPAGSHRVSWDGSDLVPGVYFARLRSGAATGVHKFVHPLR